MDENKEKFAEINKVEMIAFWTAVLIILVLAVGTCFAGSAYYVNSISGIVQAIRASSSQMIAGDTLYLRAGTYSTTAPSGYITDFVCDVVGTAAKPIIIRAARGEKVILQGNHVTSNNFVWGFYSPHVWLWDIALMETGYYTWGGAMVATFPGSAGCKIINCYLDGSLGNAISNFEDNSFEITGNVFRGCGRFLNGGGEPYAYNIYTHQKHQPTSPQLISENIMTHTWGYAVHEYCIDAASTLDSVTWRGNAIALPGWRNENRRWGFFLGSSTTGVTARGNWYDQNYVYMPQGGKGFVSWAASGLAITSSIFAVPGGMGVYFDRLPAGLTYSNNLIVGGSTSLGVNNTILTSWPVTRPADVFVRMNPYDPHRANVIVFNWNSSESVLIDPSGVLKAGEKFSLRDPLNWWGQPVLSGTWNGGQLTVPMTGLVTADALGDATGTVTVPHTAPQYAAFVLMGASTDTVIAPPPPPPPPPPPTWPPDPSRKWYVFREDSMNYTPQAAAMAFYSLSKDMSRDTTVLCYIKQGFYWMAPDSVPHRYTVDSITGRGDNRHILFTEAIRTNEAKNWVWIVDHEGIESTIERDTLSHLTTDSTWRASRWMGYIRKVLVPELYTYAYQPVSEPGVFWSEWWKGSPYDWQLDIRLEKILGDPTKNFGWDQRAVLKVNFRQVPSDSLLRATTE